MAPPVCRFFRFVECFLEFSLVVNRGVRDPELFLAPTSRDIVAKEMAGIFAKLKQTVGFLSIMSMLVSSVAACACACSHHSGEKAAKESSCHSHSESTSQHHQSGDLSINRGRAISDPGCSCNTASPRLVLKQDKKQLNDKSAPERAPLNGPSSTATLVIISVPDFGTVSFASSYLRNSTSGRAPPRPKFA